VLSLRARHRAGLHVEMDLVNSNFEITAILVLLYVGSAESRHSHLIEPA
jgi:hypothetical protein